MTLTANFSVGPQDGWVRVVSAPVTGFFSVRHMPVDIPVHFAVSTGGPPALNAQGVRANDAEFWANGALGGTPGVFATGTLTFTANPTAGQYIVINGVTWTFVASGAVGFQTNIQGSLALTLQQLVGDLTNETVGQRNSFINLLGFSASATVLTITAKNYGTAPNSYTISAGTTTATASGATLAGGTAGSSVDIYARVNNAATDKVRIYTFQN